MIRKINPNQSNVDELVSIPGIGATLAERIIEMRPFASLDDLQRVKGIGASNLAGWLKYFTLAEPEPEIPALEPAVEPAWIEAGVIAEPEAVPEPDPSTFLKTEEPAVPTVEITAISPTPEPIPDPEPSLVLAVEGPAEPTLETVLPQSAPQAPVQEPRGRRKTFTRSQTLLVAGVGSLLAFLLAVGLILGLLLGFNQGQLRFAAVNDVEALSLRLDTLSTQVAELENLETRMAAAEEALTTINSELTTLSGDLEQVEADLAAVSADVKELQAETTLFASFFESLRDLFNQFFPTP
jgi:uncharacterized coiled-coil protein SlyX